MVAVQSKNHLVRLQGGLLLALLVQHLEGDVAEKVVRSLETMDQSMLAERPTIAVDGQCTTEVG